MFEPVSLEEQEKAVEAIRREIRTGNFQADKIMTDQEVAAQLGLPEAVTHAGLSILAGEGIFEGVPQKGIKLRPVDTLAANGIVLRMVDLESRTMERIFDDPKIFKKLDFSKLRQILATPAVMPQEQAGNIEKLHVNLLVQAGFKTAAFSIEGHLDALAIHWSDRKRTELQTQFAEAAAQTKAMLDAIEKRSPEDAIRAMKKSITGLAGLSPLP
jgi:DNA-binding GntR family transcriptional regulator